MKRIFTHIAMIMFLAWNHSLLAQDETWERTGEGEIEEASFVVEKEREIVLPRQPRQFLKIAPLPVDRNELELRPYDFQTLDPGYAPLEIRGRALKLREEALEKLYGGSLNLGFGNYVTPYAELDLFNKREDRYMVGLNAKHLSSRNGPVDKRNSGNGESLLGFDTRFFGKRLHAGASGTYERSFYHFYGYPDSLEVDADTIRRTFNRFEVSASLENADKEDDFDYKVRAGYRYVNDNFSTSESGIFTEIQTEMFLRDDLSFHLDGDLLFTSYRYLESLNRNYIGVLPYVNYEYGDFDIHAGLNFVFQNDTIAERSDVLLFPVLRVDYFIGDYFSMFLKLDGDLEKVTLAEMTRENPFLNPGAALLHANRKFGLHWGLNGNLMNYLNFTAGFSLSEYRDLNFFLNDSLDISRIDLVYETGNTTVTNIYGEVVFSRLQAFFFSIRGDYFGYSTENLEQAWHRPRYKVEVDFNYNLFDKIVFGSGVYVLGGIPYFNRENDQAATLDPVIDLNFDIDYRFSEQFGAFIQFNNVVGREYQRFWRYPSRGIQVLAGIHFNF